MTFDQICRRAGGRRRYHAQRQKVQRERQMVLLALLVQLNWQNLYGMGYKLARALSVDGAQISRDINYLLQWRKSLINDLRISVGQSTSEAFAGVIAQKLLKANVHPKQGFSYTLDIKGGKRSPLTVRLRVKC